MTINAQEEVKNSSKLDTSTIVKKKPVLIIKDLVVNYYSKHAKNLKAVNNVSFELHEGESLGLVGESGCGKSTLGFSLLRLLKSNGRIDNGQVLIKLDNEYLDLTKITDKEMNVIRGNYLSMIFQAAQDCLNPLQKVDSHLYDTLNAHGIEVEKQDKLIQEIFNDLDIPLSRLNDYPFQFSGGMQQRIAIALALILDPKIVIADEPTTALDVLVQAKIIKNLKILKEERKLAMIFISHDLGVIADITNRVAVMYGGELVELGSTQDIFNSLHPYTVGLINAVPNIMNKDYKIVSIPGSPPDLRDPPSGCKFNPRCEFVKQICRDVEPRFIKKQEPDHYVKCHKWDPEIEF